MAHFSKDHPSKASTKKSRQTPIQQSDLVELVLSPLAEQIDRARFEILGKIQEIVPRLGAIDESIEMLARQVRRELDTDEMDNPHLDQN